MLVCLLFILHFVVGMIMHGQNTYGRTIISIVKHSVTGTNNCADANYYKNNLKNYEFEKESRDGPLQ